MNIINPKKLLGSKWTAVEPENSEKHFMVTEVDTDEEGTVIGCTIEAVFSRRQATIVWQDLKDDRSWIHGWK